MADIDVHSDGVTVDSEVVIKGLDDLKATTTLHSDSKVDLKADAKLDSTSLLTSRATLDPVEVTSAATVGVDLQPVAVDTCLRIELAPLPPTVVRTPWASRLGLSWLGVELVAVSLSGEVRSHLEQGQRSPQVLGTVESSGHRAAAPPATGLTVRLGP